MKSSDLSFNETLFFSPVVLSTRWKTIVWLDRQVVFCYHWKQFWVLISLSDVLFGHFVLKLNYPTSKITFCSTFRNRCVYIKYFAVHTISGGSCIHHYSNITWCYLKFTELYSKQYKHLTAACILCLALWGAP